MSTPPPSSFSALVSTTATAPLQIVTQPTPATPPSKLLIKVHAADLNPVDIQLWRSPLLSRLGAAQKGIGKDFLGVVVVAGAAVRGWRVGDECFAKSLYHCHVTAICSGPNAEFASFLGADEVVDYTKVELVPELLRLHSEKYDLFIDCVGGTDIFPRMHELLHPNASYVTIVGDKMDRNSLGGLVTYLTHPAQIIRKINGLVWGPRYGCVELAKKSGYLGQVVGLVERGEAKVVVQEVVRGALTEDGQWEKAIKMVESGRVRGKIVLAI